MTDDLQTMDIQPEEDTSEWRRPKNYEELKKDYLANPTAENLEKILEMDRKADNESQIDIQASQKVTINNWKV